MFTHALRQALCPTPGLATLIALITDARLANNLGDKARRRRRQLERMRDMLASWILG